MSGRPEALDYTALFGLMERMRLSDEQWHSTFRDIQHMERAALEEINRDS